MYCCYFRTIASAKSTTGNSPRRELRRSRQLPVLRIAVLAMSLFWVGQAAAQPPSQTQTIKRPIDSPDPIIQAICATLENYIQGSTGGEPARLRKAFHKDLNLYSIRQGQLRVWSGRDYIADTKEGQPTGESGRILAVDYENDTAIAKVEIRPPQGTAFIDYFMLLEIEGQWTIVHKMYTRKNGNAATAGFLGQRTDRPKPTRQPLSKQLSTVAQRILNEQRIPGMAVVVVENGKTVFKRGFGLANLEEKRPVDAERTLFRIGSISKAMTFLAICRLIDDGRLSRTANVEKYISTIENPQQLSEAITVDHLLTHTAGLDQIGTGRHVYDHHLSLQDRKQKRPSLAAFLAAGNLRRVSAPGEMFRYDTYGVTLAGAILEKVTASQFPAAMQQELFQPLGMNSSFVEVEENRWQDLAAGYGWEAERFRARPYEIYMTTPASSIDMTAADMGRLMEALTSDGANAHGRLFSPSMLEQVLSPQFRSHPEFPGITHGFFESFTSAEGTTRKHLRTIGHGGSLDGYRAALTLIPEKKLGVFIVANRSPESGGGDVDFRPIIDTLVERFENAPEKPNYLQVNGDNTNGASTLPLAEYVGDYYYGVYCHSPTANDLANRAWRRPSPKSVLIRDSKLVIDDEVFLPRERDVFVEETGKRLVVFGRNAEDQLSHFVYSTSPDTFEKASAALPYPDIGSLAQKCLEISQAQDSAASVRFLRENLEAESLYFAEEEMNQLGYIFLQQGHVDAAVDVFQINTERFPQSWNAFDSLGEALAEAGNKEKAIANYRESLKLNPANEAGKKRLDELQQ